MRRGAGANLLYEAANVMLTRYKGQPKLKDWAFAIATSRARREHRHPKASTTKSLPPLTPLENRIRRLRSSAGVRK
jgi:hypothetical protein